MENSLLYWIIEYIKVFLGYGFVMFIWPLVVFRKYLYEKNVTFKFCFCSTVQIVIINSVVLMLGVFHILNRWTMWIFFYGTLIWSLREHFILTEKRKKTIKYLVTGTMGWKHFFFLNLRNLRVLFKDTRKRIKKFYSKHFLEYTTLILLMIYALIYFSYGVFSNYSLGFSDLYVHHSWIYGLVQGKIFSAGVYPEGMHCFVYCIHSLTGISVYSCLHFIGSIHVLIILLSAYCFLKEVFSWRFSSIFALLLFLIIDLELIEAIASMSRLQCTLPQEFGFHAMYICALYLILYLKNYKKTFINGIELKACWDDNLLIFMLALSVTIMTHFYITIMAFFFCFSFVLFSLRHVFHKKHFIPLVVAVVLGLLIAVVPMGCSLAMGNHFQGSIDWALGVMKGSEKQENVTAPDINNEEDIQINFENSNISTEDNNFDKNEIISAAEELNISNSSVQTEIEPAIITRIVNKIRGILQGLFNKLMIIYREGYVGIYGEVKARIIVSSTVLVLSVYFVYRLIGFIYYKIIKRRRAVNNLYPSYLPLILLSFIFITMIIAYALGLPMLIEGLRICSTANLITLAVIVLPLDMIFTVLISWQREDFLEMCSVLVSICIILVVCLTGSYHGFLYFDIKRYNAPVVVANRIMSSLPDNTYTIISTTDEIYQVIENGRHEEIFTFIQKQDKDNYTIPTEYLFFFIEKKPIKPQTHYFEGPTWLAMEKYHLKYGSNSTYCSFGTDYVSLQISDEYADKPIRYFGLQSEVYTDLESRTILESKMYRWCQKFNEIYPNELQVYYEDDEFICYYIHQNPQFLYNLVLK